MKVVTSDNKTIDDFEGLLSVVSTIREALSPKKDKQSSFEVDFPKLTVGSEYSAISSSSSSSSSGSTKSLAGHNASVQRKSLSKEEFGGNMKSVLYKMREYHWTGKVYSQENGKIFTDDFSQELNKLLGLFQSLQVLETNNAEQNIGITASQLQDALKWMASVINVVPLGGDSKQLEVHTLIGQLKEQGGCTVPPAVILAHELGHFL
jgi:hypothetical protein